MNKVEKETFKLMHGDHFTYICGGAILILILGVIFPFIHKSSDGTMFGSIMYFSIFGLIALASGLGGYISFKPVAERKFKDEKL